MQAINFVLMSIYLEFPAIAEYPLYSSPLENELSPNEKAEDKTAEQNLLDNYLALRWFVDMAG
jgi:hypothetical protein